MAFDNIHLEKGMYHEAGRSFTQVLEQLDPSEGYRGTPLENTDAFQRQLKRFGIRVKGADGKTYLAHTLNNTCVAPPRMLIAFLENHLQKDGTVTIPKCLQPYMGGKEVLVPKHK